MPSTIRVSVEGITELRADLEAMEVGLGRELAQVLRFGAVIVATAAKPLTPYDPLHDVARKDGLPHIRDSLYAIATAAGSAVAARHPGAVVHEYGGTIAPAGHPIEIPQSAMAHKAGTAQLNRINALLEQRINRLISQHSR